MIRAAIYARFSSDRQNERSTADQIASCRELCAREGYAVAATFEDRAISGASTVNRPGFQAMMRAAEARSFDMLIAEDVDRIARDQGDWHAARKRLDFLGIKIYTLSGPVTRIDGSLRALMGEMFLENLAVHTRRGVEAVIRDGRHAGGSPYGYSHIADRPGILEIVEAEAAIVREIFERFAIGQTPRTIAGDLNRRNVATKRGGDWRASAIYGNGRGNGILRNDIYAGRIVWNKVRMIKNPDTGKRISRVNPPDQHRIAAADHLRIVPDELWNRVQARMGKNIGAQRPHGPRRMLSGLIRCAACGGTLTSYGKDRGGIKLMCANAKETGTCDSRRKFSRNRIEAAVIDGLRHHLDHPQLISDYAEAYNEERKRLRAASGNQRAKLMRRQGEVTREIERAIDAIVKHGIDPTTLAERIKALETERDGIAADLERIGEAATIIVLHPAALAQYRADVEQIAAIGANADPAADGEAVAAIRRLIERVIVRPGQGRGDIAIELHGRLAALTDSGIFPAGIVVGGYAGSGGALQPYPPTPNPLFMLDLAA